MTGANYRRGADLERAAKHYLEDNGYYVIKSAGSKGAHKDRSDGLCLLEAVAWFAGEPHSDHPACVSPVLAAYGRSLNDALGDDSRRLLIPFISVLSRTAGDGLDEARGYLALDWIIRVYTPAWLDVAGLTREARALRDLRCISDMAAVQDARPVVLSAWDAAWAAARAAAGDAARAKLAPTVADLQTSAIALYDVLITGEAP